MPALWFLLSVNTTTPISQFIWKRCPTASHLAPRPDTGHVKFCKQKHRPCNPGKRKKTYFSKTPFLCEQATLTPQLWDTGGALPWTTQSFKSWKSTKNVCPTSDMTPWHVTYDIYLNMLLTSKTWPSNFSYRIYGPGPDLTCVQLL